MITINNATIYASASDITGPSTIHKEMNQVFTVIDLLKLYDNDVFIQNDGYTGYGNVPGQYIITLERGTSTKDVTVIVVDNWGDLPNSNDVLFVADAKDIYVANDRILTNYEIIYYIYNKTGYVNTQYQFLYEEILDEYHYADLNDDHKIPQGDYELTFKLTYFSGEQITHSVIITAVDLPELSGTILQPPKSPVEKLMSVAPVIIIVVIIVTLISNRKKRGFNYV